MTTRTQAIRIERHGGPETLTLTEVELPDPAPGQALVRVLAAGVNPADWKLREGLVPRFGPPPFTLGIDFSGEVVALGPDTDGPAPGTVVFGNVFPPHGSYAGHVLASVDAMAAAPATVDSVVAAALPGAGQTAYQAVVHTAGVRAGDRVLVHAAAGGVGHMAVQIAKAHGAYVLGTARSDKHALLRRLGVDEPIDYTAVDFATAVTGVDIVIDPIADQGYGVRSLDVLRPGGILVDVRGTGPDRTATRTAAAVRGLRFVQFGFAPSPTDLTAIAALVDAGRLRPEISRVLALREAALAHELSASGRVVGKIVLVP